MNLRSLVNSVMGARGAAAGARRPAAGARPAAGPTAGGVGGQSAKDAAIGRGVRKLLRGGR